MERKTCHGLGGVGRLSFRDYRVYAAKASRGEHAKVVWIPEERGRIRPAPYKATKATRDKETPGCGRQDRALRRG